MKRVRPVFISHKPYRSPEAKLRNKQGEKEIDTATHHQISESQALVGLGFIASLLFIGGVQLYRSVNASSNYIEPASVKSALTDSEDSTRKAPSVKLDSQKTKVLTIQNTISNGKF